MSQLCFPPKIHPPSTIHHPPSTVLHPPSTASTHNPPFPTPTQPNLAPLLSCSASLPISLSNIPVVDPGINQVPSSSPPSYTSKLHQVHRLLSRKRPRAPKEISRAGLSILAIIPTAIHASLLIEAGPSTTLLPLLDYASSLTRPRLSPWMSIDLAALESASILDSRTFAQQKHHRTGC